MGASIHLGYKTKNAPGNVMMEYRAWFRRLLLRAQQSFNIKHYVAVALVLRTDIKHFVIPTLHENYALVQIWRVKYILAT